MDNSVKILIGAAATALLAWGAHCTTCANAPGGMANVPAIAGAAPATQAAVDACQGDINSLMAGKTINFQSGSAYLAADSAAILADVAKTLKPCAGTHVEVQGHTDLTGSADVNQSISQARADAVVKALVADGVPAAQITAKGYGSTQPLENARSSAANAKNRRTVFAVTAAAAPLGGQ